MICSGKHHLAFQSALHCNSSYEVDFKVTASLQPDRFPAHVDVWRSHGCLGGTGDNRALIALLVLLVPLNVTYPDKCGKYQPIVGIMPLYLVLSDQGLGHMKWVKDERCI